MKNIEILDCTLRDGGYVNKNTFGYNNIRSIIKKLEESNIDYIECGYISDSIPQYNENVTEYTTFKELQQQSLINNNNNLYTLMLLGEKYNIENLKECENNQNNIIRMSFHKHNLQKAIEYAKRILEKGYKLFLQPTVIMNYKEDEIIAMLNEFNKLNIMGVAIVDTFGQMLPKDVARLTKIFDRTLNSKFKLTFHAHNNFEMAYANAICFIDTVSEEREVVIDTSLYGMGRGAGNLPTELMANYLNENYMKNYNIDSLLEVNDTIISKIKQSNPWGYSLSYYLSAKYGCHPSYVLYLLNKNMLESQDINKVLQMISSDKKVEYDKDYIEELYLTYNEQSINDIESYSKLKNLLGKKKLVLIGPGESITRYYSKIQNYLESNDCFVILINNLTLINHDAIFYSNKKRYYTIDNHSNEKLEIITSNISIENRENRIIFDYNNSLSRKDNISDSALLVLLSILEKAEIKEVVLAGFDGFSYDPEKNYYSIDISYILDKNYIDDLNEIMSKNIRLYQKNMKIISLTPSININSSLKEE